MLKETDFLQAMKKGLSAGNKEYQAEKRKSAKFEPFNKI